MSVMGNKVTKLISYWLNKIEMRWIAYSIMAICMVTGNEIKVT